MKDSSRILHFVKKKKKKSKHLSHLLIFTGSVLSTPGSGNFAWIAWNKKNSVINNNLHCRFKLTYTSNLIWHSHWRCERKVGWANSLMWEGEENPVSVGNQMGVWHFLTNIWLWAKGFLLRGLHSLDRSFVTHCWWEQTESQACGELEGALQHQISFGESKRPWAWTSLCGSRGSGDFRVGRG